MGGARNPTGERKLGKEVAADHRCRGYFTRELLVRLYALAGFDKSKVPNIVRPLEPKKPKLNLPAEKYAEDLKAYEAKKKEFDELLPIYNVKLELYIQEFVCAFCDKLREQERRRASSSFSLASNPASVQRQSDPDLQFGFEEADQFTLDCFKGLLFDEEDSSSSGQYTPNYVGSAPQNGNGFGQQVQNGNGFGQRAQNGNGFGQQVQNGNGFGQQVQNRNGFGQQVQSPVCLSQQVKSPVCPSQQVQSPVCPIQQVQSPVCPSQQVQSPVCPNQQVQSPAYPHQQNGAFSAQNPSNSTYQYQQMQSPAYSYQQNGHCPPQQSPIPTYAPQQNNRCKLTAVRTYTSQQNNHSPPSLIPVSTYSPQQNNHCPPQLSPLNVATNFHNQGPASQYSTSDSFFSPPYTPNNAAAYQNHNGSVQHDQWSQNQHYGDPQSSNYRGPEQEQRPISLANSMPPPSVQSHSNPASLRGTNKAIRQQMSASTLPRLPTNRKHKQPNGIITEEMKSSQNQKPLPPQNQSPSDLRTWSRKFWEKFNSEDPRK